MRNRIIFILPNIYEIINGVSTKYIKFINYLSNSYKIKDIIIITTFKDNDLINNLINNLNYKDTIKIIKTKGLQIPFYPEIKIPIINYNIIKKYIQGNEIIIFNGEFLWIYNILDKLKKKYKDLKIYPTMHTDYVYYANEIYSFSKIINTLNYLDHYLENKKFSGIIVTGEKMVEKYSKFTNSIFNANEINLEIFNSQKIDNYNLNNPINFIYTGRISKEKNITEIFDCCLMLLNKNYLFNINIIGDGPFLENLKSLLDLEYRKIKDNIIFHGSKNHNEIFQLYQILDNRIFIFTSLSETFGKTPMEAGATGIPIFIKNSENCDKLYINKENAFIFNDKNDFVEIFEYFLKLNEFDKRILISNSINNIKKYDQKIIFEEWLEFILNGKVLKDKAKLNILSFFTFHGLSQLINCSGMLIDD